MRKVTRKSLDELAKVMPIISEENQKAYVGGTSGYTGTTGYTGSTGYSGTTGTAGLTGWTGYYDGDHTGYVGGNTGSSTSSTGYYGTTGTTGTTGYYGTTGDNYGSTGSYTGSAYGDPWCLNQSEGNGNPPYTGNNSSNSENFYEGVMDSGTAYTKDNPCSYQSYCIQAESGTWTGGYVQVGDGSVYISEVQVNKIAGEGETYTFPEYIGSLQSDTMDSVLGKIIDAFPVINSIYNNINEEYRNMTLSIQEELMQKGYNKDNVFFIKRTNIPGTLTGDVRFDVYDVSTGKIVASRIL